MLKRIFSVFQNLFHRNRIENELNEEVRFHLEMQIEKNLADGMNPVEARRKAMLNLGGVEQVKETCREVHAGSFIEVLIRDVRYALRTLRCEPGFVAVVVLTLAMTIGANTAIFSVAKAVLLQPLPYPGADRLVNLWGREKDGSLGNTGFLTFVDWKSVGSFESMAAMSYWQPTLTGRGDPEPLEGTSVSSSFFDVLGVHPFLGRTFLLGEDQPEQNHVVILSYGLWERRFQKDESLIGKQIFLNGMPRTVVGVMPRNFQSLLNYTLKESEIWRPLGYDATLPWACRTCNHLTVVARMRPGITVEQASRDLDACMKALIVKYRKEYGNAGATAVPLREQFVSGVQAVLTILFVAVGILLVIACANTAGLMLARGMRKTQEMVVRAALGASPSRLLRQLLTESLMLAALGGILGILLARWFIPVLVLHVPQEIPRLQSVRMDYGVLLFASVTTIVAGLLFGIIPAWSGSRIHLTDSLQESHRMTTSGGRQKLRKVLVSLNIGLAIILLAGAGLVLQSIRNQLEQKLGFRPENVMTLSVAAVGIEYEDSEKLIRFWRDIANKTRALPGVDAAGLVSQLPLSKNVDMYTIRAKDKQLANPEDAPSAERFAVSSEYTSALLIPLLRGRRFTEQDRAETQPVILINRTFAETIWPGENPIGKQVQVGDTTSPWRSVVGVLENVRHRSLHEPFHLQLYHPMEQWPIDSAMTLMVRSKVEPFSLLTSIRSLVRSVDSKSPIYDVASMNQVLKSTLAQSEFLLDLLRIFSLTALFLAAIGIYGVMAYMAGARFREIGVRMALGADRFAIVALLTADGIRLAVTGIVLGLVGCFLLTRFLRSVLFGVIPLDPVALLAATFILLFVSIVACALPSFRASRYNPVEALRSESPI